MVLFVKGETVKFSFVRLRQFDVAGKTARLLQLVSKIINVKNILPAYGSFFS